MKADEHRIDTPSTSRLTKGIFTQIPGAMDCAVVVAIQKVHSKKTWATKRNS